MLHNQDHARWPASVLRALHIPRAAVFLTPIPAVLHCRLASLMVGSGSSLHRLAARRMPTSVPSVQRICTLCPLGQSMQVPGRLHASQAHAHCWRPEAQVCRHPRQCHPSIGTPPPSMVKQTSQRPGSAATASASIPQPLMMSHVERALEHGIQC